jgi:hypothetical protein
VVVDVVLVGDREDAFVDEGADALSTLFLLLCQREI